MSANDEIAWNAEEPTGRNGDQQHRRMLEQEP